MKHNIILKKDSEIEAPVSEVWKALTNPAILKETMFGCDVITNWEMGGKILFKGHWEGKEFVDKGTTLDFQEGKSYEYDYWSTFSGLPDLPENYSIIKFHLTKSKNKTILNLEQSNFATEMMYMHSDRNWDIALNSFKKQIKLRNSINSK